ncbi:hypothetical protein ACHAXT_003577 [Thalassiosira profunda]
MHLFFGLSEAGQRSTQQNLDIVVHSGDAIAVSVQTAIGVVGGGRDGDHEALAGELRRDVARLSSTGPSERWEQGASRIELEVEVEVSLAQRLALRNEEVGGKKMQKSWLAANTSAATPFLSAAIS